MLGSDSFVHKTLRPWPNGRLRRAAIVGHTTTTTTRLWLRTGKRGKFTLLLYENLGAEEDPRFEQLKSPRYPLDNLPQDVIRHDFEIKDFQNDTTYVADLSGLKPATIYGYALHDAEDGRIVIGHDRLYSFRTLPEESAPFQFALYSCHMPYDKTIFGNVTLKNLEMWNYFKDALNCLREKVRFVIGGGDQVYTDGVESLSIWNYLDKFMRAENGDLLPTQEDMVTWYRDIYRGYWGFEALNQIFSDFPIYMIWDDHDLGDGCGSYYLGKNELRMLLPSLKSDRETDGKSPDAGKEGSRKPTYKEGLQLYEGMMMAARQVYYEYQHSHNPQTPEGQWDYSFFFGDCAFYFLDGRGHRDVERSSYRVLGEQQFKRFESWLASEKTRSQQFLFVLSAVPLFHVRAALADKKITDVFPHSYSDDLRDSWEHDLHDEERAALTNLLFEAAGRGQKVSILSGDVHLAAAYRLHNDNGSTIYQLTSSAITYNTSLLSGWLLGQFCALPEEGTTDEGYTFHRMALYPDSNFSIVKVDAKRGKVVFDLYGKHIIAPPRRTLLNKNLPFAEQPDRPLVHAFISLELDFK